MGRTVLGVLDAVVVLVAAAIALALGTGPSSRPASQLVVQGHVTGTVGQPVSGVKVWLNVLQHGNPTGAVTVVASDTTSDTGGYAIRVPPQAALGADAVHGVIRFMLMVGDSAGWDTAGFSRHLVPAPTGAVTVAPAGGTVTADLLLRH